MEMEGPDGNGGSGWRVQVRRSEQEMKNNALKLHFIICLFWQKIEMMLLVHVYQTNSSKKQYWSKFQANNIWYVQYNEILIRKCEVRNIGC
jgi:hypothetical protein